MLGTLPSSTISRKAWRVLRAREVTVGLNLVEWGWVGLGWEIDGWGALVGPRVVIDTEM